MRRSSPALLRRALVEASPLHVQRDHGRRRELDQRLRLRAGERRERRASSTRSSTRRSFEGLRAVALELSLGIVRGGEGATKLVAITVSGARSPDEAWTAARVIANSPLVKTADPRRRSQLGRLVAAAGRSGVTFSLERAVVRIGPHVLFSDGQPHDELAPQAAEYLQGKELEIEVNVGAGGSRSRDDLHVRSVGRVREDQRRVPNLTISSRQVTRQVSLALTADVGTS